MLILGVLPGVIIKHIQHNAPCQLIISHLFRQIIDDPVVVQGALRVIFPDKFHPSSGSSDTLPRNACLLHHHYLFRGGNHSVPAHVPVNEGINRSSQCLPCLLLSLLLCLISTGLFLEILPDGSLCVRHGGKFRHLFSLCQPIHGGIISMVGTKQTAQSLKTGICRVIHIGTLRRFRWL